MARNWDGLDSGAFALRVHPWSVSLLSGVVTYPMNFTEQLNTNRFRDPSAFQGLLQARDSLVANSSMKGRGNWAEIPMRWFNSWPINNAYSEGGDWIFSHNMTEELFDKGTNEVYKDGNGGFVRPWKVMQGDMMVHFAGTNPVRDSWMGRWLDRTAEYTPEWNNATKQEDLKVEAHKFWRDNANQRMKGMDLERIRFLHTSQAAMHAEQVALKNIPLQRANSTTSATDPAVSQTSEFKLQHSVVRMTGIPQLLQESQNGKQGLKKPTEEASPKRFTKMNG
jgi:hypothetical protein